MYPSGDPMPRPQALSLASARRELWRIHHGHSTQWLTAQLRIHEYHVTDYCRALRGDHAVSVSTWYIRMIRTELRRRGVHGES